MAIDLTLKSVGITNREAVPPVKNNPGQCSGSSEKCAFDYYAAVTASLSITSVIRIVTIPSNAIVSEVRISSQAQAAGAFDVGIYRTNKDGGAVVSVALFGSAVSAAGILLNVDVLGESTVYTLVKQRQRVWEAAGLTVDPICFFDVCLTVATTDVTTGTGAIGLRVRYTDNA
jgi:hypothetical protein